MLSNEVQATLTSALGITGPQLVAVVGGGGKTTALQRLAVEHMNAAGGIIATTTTSMFAHQLACLAPLVIEDRDGALLATRSGDALGSAGIVALAKSFSGDGKLKGLAPTEVDAIWRARVADSIVVEADGSRCMPLKAFGVAEPRLPSETTAVVVIAGLEVLGQPLDEAHVHRAELLTSILQVAKGDKVTAQLLGAAMALQVARVRKSTPGARVIVLLNKADTDDRMQAGAQAATNLHTAAADGGHGAAGHPDRIVVGSLWRGAYYVVESYDIRHARVRSASRG